MIGAVVGDVVGSVYEFRNIKTKKFDLITKSNFFTDDTVMTIAIMEWLMNQDKSVVYYLQKWGRKYPASYGGSFGRWLLEKNPQPYYSFGNGAAMRISPIAYVAKNLKELEKLVKEATEVTHNHPEGVRGALTTAICVYFALKGCSKNEIRDFAINVYPEIESFSYEQLQREYTFDESCQGTVPQAIYCFLISDSFEDCIRTTISIGGDCDTTAAISGAIAEAFYGVPSDIEKKTLGKLTSEMRKVITDFDAYLMRR